MNDATLHQRIRVSFTIILMCLCVATSAAVSSYIPVSNSTSSGYLYSNAPQLFATEDAGLLVTVWEASKVSTLAGSADQFVALSFSANLGAVWSFPALEVPQQVNIGRPMWRPAVVVAPNANSNSTLQGVRFTGTIVLYYAQQVEVEVIPGGNIYKTSASFSLHEDGSMKLLGGWSSPEMIAATFGSISGGAQILRAAMPPFSTTFAWALPVVQAASHGYDLFENILLLTNDTGATHQAIVVNTPNSGSGSAVSLGNASNFFGGAQLVGSCQLEDVLAASSSSGSSPSSSSSSGPPPTSPDDITLLLVNPSLPAVGTTASTNGGASFQGLQTVAVQLIGDGTVNLSSLFAATAYIPSRVFIAFLSATTSGPSIFVREIDTITGLTSGGNSAEFTSLELTPSSMAVAVHSVWGRASLVPPEALYIVFSSNHTAAIGFASAQVPSVGLRAPVDSTTAFAITFSIIGSVSCILVTVFVVGHLKAKYSKAQDGRLKAFYGSAAEPGHRQSSAGLRHSVSERTVLV